MKIKTIHMVAAWALLSLGCSDWLSVSPRTEKPTEELFNSQNGFRDALTGVYLEMMSDKSYGEYLTMSKIEYLVNFWDPQKGSPEEALTLHKYDNGGAEQLLGSIYEQQFKVILAVNSILEYVDQKQSVFSPGVYEAVKGECLAIRAMCHLDILRLFGPVPAEAGNSPILSYVETVTKELHRPVSFADYKVKLMDDLRNAEVLLEQHLKKQGEITDDYFRYRNIRMNYYAVKALQARAHLWFDNTEEACTAAMDVIGARDEAGKLLFSLGAATDFDDKNYTLPCEQILAIYRFDLYDKYSSLFKGEVLYKGTKEATVKKELYGNTGSDIREMNLWNLLVMPNKSKFYVCDKYNVAEKISGDKDNDRVIPLVRLSEMYLIGIETGIESQAQQLWRDFLVSRNVSVYALPQDAAERRKAIVSEYRKEFYAEGVTFYLYKRLNLPKIQWLWAPSALKVNYVLPLPKSEIINN